MSKNLPNHWVEVQDCRKIMDHFREIYRIYANLIKKHRRMWTCNRWDLQTLGSQPVMPNQKSPQSLNSTGYGWLAIRMPFSWENGILNYLRPRIVGLDWDAPDPDTWQSTIGNLTTLPLSMGPSHTSKKVPTTPFPTHKPHTLLWAPSTLNHQILLWSTPAGSSESQQNLEAVGKDVQSQLRHKTVQ